MTEFYLRTILVIGLVFIGVFWKITSPSDSFKNFLLSLPHIRSWPLTFFQALPIIQIVAGYFSTPAFSWSVGKFDIVLETTGIIIFLLGIILASWAKWEMKTNWGRPAQHEIIRQKRLVISGPFAFSRNPIYLGLLLVFFGFEFALRSYCIFFTIPLYLYECWIIKQEEKLLEKHFGQHYLNYKRRVSRFWPPRC